MSLAEAPAPTGRLLFSTKSFAEMGIEPDLLRGIEAMGFKHATEVQTAVFDPILAGKDVVVQSKTGSGKTAAFGLPMMQRMKRHIDDAARRADPHPRGLVLSPTRELAIQVEHELAQIGKIRDIETIAIYGGVGFDKQNAALRSGVDIVVGTPGRLMDQIEKGNLSLDQVQTFVLDEADEMLSMGFWDDVMWIAKRLPKTRQTLLFSATLPLTIERAARQIQIEPIRIDLSTDAISVDSVTHLSYNTDERMPKPRNLLFIMEVQKPESAIIFCNTRADVALIGSVLGNQGYEVEMLSGDLSQAQRERVMNAIKGHNLRFMVATDIAARGIDISALSHVFNYSLPEDPEVYVHRAGRTGRIGNTGICVSLVSGAEEQTKTVLKRDYGVIFHEQLLPDLKSVERMRSERIVKELFEKAGQAEVTQHLPTAEAVLASKDAQTIVAFLVKQYLSKASRPQIGGGEPDSGASSKPRYEERPPREERAPREAHREPVRAVSHEPRHDTRREPAREPRPDTEQETGNPKMFVSLGEQDGLTADTLKATLAELSGVDAEALNDVEIRRTSAYVRVSPADADKLLTAHGKTFKDRQVVVEKARRRRR